MVYYRDPAGKVFGYDSEDKSQSNLIEEATSAGWEDITSSWPPSANARQPLILSAQDALAKSDVTMVRCYSANPSVAVPTAWTTYRAALRDIINGTDTTSETLPATPSYPAGT